MIEGEARFPGGTPLIRVLTMQRSIVRSLLGLALSSLALFHSAARYGIMYGSTKGYPSD